MEDPLHAVGRPDRALRAEAQDVRASPPNNQSNLHAVSLIYSSFVALTPTTLPHLSTHSIATPKFYGKDEKVPFGIAMIMGLQHMYAQCVRSRTHDST